MNDSDFLKQALLIAEYSPEPVACGAVLVMDGEVVAKAFNSEQHDKLVVNHAEINVLQLTSKALHQDTFAGATLYCSCEPCVMCLSALSLAKIKRIVYAHTRLELFPSESTSRIDSSDFVKHLNYFLS